MTGLSSGALLVTTTLTCAEVACTASGDPYAGPPPRADSGAAKDATTDGSSDSGDDGSSHGDAGCKPRTCAELGVECGMVPDQCSSAVYCGECPTGTACGGAGPNKCGTATCTPKTCSQLGASCGIVSNGCNAALDCGSCSNNQTCAGGGVPNQCGCTPKSCASIGADCGLAPNGCGDIQDCGGCASDQFCGGAGPNLCGLKPCTPWTCAQVGADCGQAPDKCGDTLSCGTCSSGTCALNKCVCYPTWMASVADGMSATVLASTGELYAVGVKADSGWVARLDPCDGAVKASQTVIVAGATSSSASSLAMLGTQLLVSGRFVSATDPGEGMYALLAGTTLTPSWINPLHGSDGLDEAWGVVAPSNGSVWLAGTTDATVSPSIWGIKATSSGAACGFQAATGAGLGRGLIAMGDDVYLYGALEGAAVVTRFAASSCSASGPCPCAPVWQSSPIKIGQSHTEARSAVVVGSSIYLAGFTLETSGSIDYEAFVARVDLSSGQLLGVYRWNPTAQFDGFLSIATDMQRLYVSGGKNYDGTASWASATGVLVALPFALNSSTTPEWTMNLTAVQVALGVTVDTAGSALIVSGRAATGGFVERCTNAGVCP